MSVARVTATLALVAASLAAAGGVTGRALARGVPGDMVPSAPTLDGRFPHARHAGLFPTCVGCHAGIVSGEVETRFPAPTTCASCHDGSARSRVVWDGPAPLATNLRFSHVEHAREITADSQRTGGGGANPSLQCGACHRMESDARFLAVARAPAATCLACHAHAAPSHLDAPTDCRACHLPLAQAAALPMERIAGFPRPPSHAAPDFMRRHGPAGEADLARCATCHAQQSCARCHVDARTQRTIAALAPDARVARLVAGRAGAWPTPATHARHDWTYEHGRDATRATASCATCHAQPSCRTCHIGTGAARVIRRLPMPEPGGSPGVQLRGTRVAQAAMRGAAKDEARAPLPAGGVTINHPPWSLAATQGDSAAASGRDSGRAVRVHATDYARNHGTEASAQQLDCTGCHTQRFCSDCHAGETRRRFHPPNFVQRHAPEAWGREQDCASCHNPEAFCRACHSSAGLTSQGGLSSSYHTRQPGWLLQHGQAARQGLETCTSCHAQRDCMQCHSRAGWNVSPHGRDFDATRMSRKARGLCTACHVGDPLTSRR